VSDRLVRFPGTSEQQIEALPQPLRWTVQRTIFHLLDEPVPALAEPFPLDDPGRDRISAYQLVRGGGPGALWAGQRGRLTISGITQTVLAAAAGPPESVNGQPAPDAPTPEEQLANGSHP
jgi:hypothetical protein